jgi:hypothetical protein
MASAQDGFALGPVSTIATNGVAHPEAPGKAGSAARGGSKGKEFADAWGICARNPPGRGWKAPALRQSSLIWNDQTSLLCPCAATFRPPAPSPESC